VMHIALQIAAALAFLSEPFLPFTSDKLKKMLNISSEDLKQNHNQDTVWDIVSSEDDLLHTAHQVGKSALLFSKIEDEQIQQQLDKLHKTKTENVTNETPSPAIAPQKETIEFDDFMKMDMRIGTIIEAEKMPKADRLLILKVDTGIDTRTIVSGLAEHFAPEEIIGQRVTVLVNLAPRKVRGVESQGMILMTETSDGKLAFMIPDEKEKSVDNVAGIN